MIQRHTAAALVLTAGLVLVFGYFGITKFTDPLIWIGFMPDWINGLSGISKNSWLQVFGVIEIVLALLIVIPVRRIRQAGAVLMVLHLIGVLSQVGWNETAVRDLCIMASAAALFLLV